VFLVHSLFLFFLSLLSVSFAVAPKNLKPVAIYHAHNLSFNEIRDKLPTLAQLGFSHIQISPPQKSRDTLPDHKKKSPSKHLKERKIWWLHYQPENYKIDDTFGTQTELQQLVDEAQKVDIKIIVDVVLTHLRAPDHIEFPNWKSAYLACQLCKYVKGKEPDNYVQCTDVRGNPFNTESILPNTDILNDQTILADIRACKLLSSDAADYLKTLYFKLQPIVANFLGVPKEKVDLKTISQVIYPWRLGYQPGSWTSGFGAPALRTDHFLVSNLQKQYLSLLVNLGVGGFRYDAASNLSIKSLESFKAIPKHMSIFKFFQYGEIVDTLENTTNWKNTMGISITNYPFLLILKNALSHHGSLQSIWGFYSSHVHDDDVIFTATHDTFGEDASLRYYRMEDAHDSRSITNDNLLALSIILAIPKGVPLILHDYVDDKMPFYAPHPHDLKRYDAPTKMVQNGLKFRKIMVLEHHDQDHFSYYNDDPNVLIIERYQTPDKRAGGFAIINKGLEEYSYQDLLIRTKFIRGCYQSLEEKPVIMIVSKDRSIKVISGNPNVPKREAQFFISVHNDKCLS
jgi:hypothetical protein